MPASRDADTGDALQHKYAELLALRQTAPEAEAKRLANSLSEVQATSQELIASLRAEIATRGESHGPNEELNERVRQLERLVGVYRMLSGTEIELSADGRPASCTGVGERRRHECTVDMAPEDGDEGDLGYQPASGDGVCKFLPDYLQDGIVCACSPCSTWPRMH